MEKYNDKIKNSVDNLIGNLMGLKSINKLKEHFQEIITQPKWPRDENV